MNWYMVTVVGKDQPGIAAGITQILFQAGYHLGEASMVRLGSSFTMMMMVRYNDKAAPLRALLLPFAESLALQLHVDDVDSGLHRHQEPNVRISVFGSDRAGIVAQVTGALAEAALNITNLETDVGGTEQDPIYIMRIEGYCDKGIDVLQKKIKPFQDNGIHITVSDIDLVLA